MKKKNEQHGGSYTRLYNIWRCMKQRCYNPNNSAYSRYGGKGITVCKRWRYSFSEFLKWAMANGYNDELTIDRIDSTKGYMPTNCQWITRSENSSKDNPFTLKGYTGEALEYQKARRHYANLMKLYNSLIKDGVDPSTIKKPIPPEKPAI